MRTSFKYIVLIVHLVAFSFLGEIYSQNNTNSELGIFPIRNISREEYNALPQNWDIIQDERGVIYVGNTSGILEFDGTYWNTLFTSNQREVKSFSIDSHGRIYVGGYNDFGYLKPNNQGSMTFVSLLSKWKKSEVEFGDVWKVHVKDSTVFFQASYHWFSYANDIVKDLKFEHEISNSFLVNNQLFISVLGKGYYAFENDSLLFVEGSESLKDDLVYALLPYNNAMIGAFNTKGLIILDYNSEINSLKTEFFPTEIDSFLTSNQIYCGALLNENFYSIGTFNGLGVINSKGNFNFWLNESVGIRDNKILNQYVDAQNNLWLSLPNGLTYVQVGSPLTYFNKMQNLQGTIESITRFNGKIHVATSVGPYFLNSSTDYKTYPKFEKVKNFKAIETWIVDAATVNDSEILLVEQNTHISEITRANDTTRIFEGIPWAIHQSVKNREQFYFGVEEGLVVKQRRDGKWMDKGNVDGIDKRITDIREFSTDLWLSAENRGIYKIKNYLANYDNIEFFPDTLIDASGPYILMEWNNELLLGTANGIYSYKDSINTFSYYTELNDALGIIPRYIHRMSVDTKGKLWLATYIDDEEREELGFFEYNDESQHLWNPIPFLGNIKGQIMAIYHDIDGVTWLGGSEGLFRYDSKIDKNYKQDFHCLIRKVMLGEDSTLFKGTYFDEKGQTSTLQPESLKPHLKFAYNSLIFNYSAMNIDMEHPTKYSYYLEGYDKKWSEWTVETKKEYTNLPYNYYKFRVKAMNVYGHESVEGTFEFEVFPPWYRTWWAYILFVFMALGVVYVIVTQYTKYLRAVIKEKTAEIVEQKDEIEKQKDEITASIKYAERIQKAIVPTFERATELLPEHFVLWRPRDIVSGDFWWMTEKNGMVAIAAADSTGHGVPGAFVSMLGVSFLNEIVGKMQTLQANEILNQLRLHVKTTMKQTGKEGESKDGMDIAIVILDLDNKRIQYAGAYNPLFLIRKGELIETKANRNPIGIYIKEAPFTNHVIEVQKGDTLYIFSDGFVDQFGGEKGGKFKTKNFKELLLKIQYMPMLEQELLLDRTVDDWRGELDQVDDIIIVGIRI